MTTSAERMRALRERRRFRRLTIGVSEDDLRVIAKHGYEGVASTDHDCRSQAISLFHQRHRCRRGYIPSSKCRTAARISA
jgi:hypothetical protein